MEKDNKTNQLRLSQRKIFPNLRKTYSASRNFITLSKVEIDKNVYTMESTNSNFMARQITTSFSHKRIISGVNSRQIIQSQMSKTYRNFLEPNTEKRKSQNMIKQKSVSISNLATQNKQHTDKNQQVPLIQKAKISTKPIGIIQGYSVNSHPGSLSTNNEDRICVITNLNKSILKDTQISFFSIYDGKNGVAKAEYFRDHFHNVLIKDKDFNRDLETSIRRSILLMQQNFAKVSSQLESIPVSSTNLLICIIMDHCAYIASMGDNKMVISTKKGKEIINPLLVKQGGIKKSASKLKLKVPKVSVSMVKLELKELDFIVLGSEGLFQNLSEIQIGNKIWYELLERTTKNFHLALGQSTNTIMKDVFQQTSTKNVSLILIAFANTYSCFQQNSVLDLPFVTFATPTCIYEF